MGHPERETDTWSATWIQRNQETNPFCFYEDPLKCEFPPLVFHIDRTMTLWHFANGSVPLEHSLLPKGVHVREESCFPKIKSECGTGEGGEYSLLSHEGFEQDLLVFRGFSHLWNRINLLSESNCLNYSDKNCHGIHRFCWTTLCLAEGKQSFRKASNILSPASTDSLKMSFEQQENSVTLAPSKNKDRYKLVA